MSDNAIQHVDFTLPTEKEAALSFASLLDANKWVVLYFYPRDNTSGCSKQAQDFKEYYDQLRQLGAEVVGISRDSVSSHQKFIDKYELPFSLFSDGDSEVCEQFGVLQEKSMYGRKYMGIVRSTFIIDAQKKVVNSWINVKVPGHVEEVYNYLRSL